ncbi:hypothetical protein Ahia01_000000600 [Argonauta hians]
MFVVQINCRSLGDPGISGTHDDDDSDNVDDDGDDSDSDNVDDDDDDANIHLTHTCMENRHWIMDDDYDNVLLTTLVWKTDIKLMMMMMLLIIMMIMIKMPKYSLSGLFQSTFDEVSSRSLNAKFDVCQNNLESYNKHARWLAGWLASWLAD